MGQPKCNILNIIIPGKAVILWGISVKILILLFATILRCSFYASVEGFSLRKSAIN